MVPQIIIGRSRKNSAKGGLGKFSDLTPLNTFSWLGFTQKRVYELLWQNIHHRLSMSVPENLKFSFI